MPNISEESILWGNQSLKMRYNGLKMKIRPDKFESIP